MPQHNAQFYLRVYHDMKIHEYKILPTYNMQFHFFVKSIPRIQRNRHNISNKKLGTACTHFQNGFFVTHLITRWLVTVCKIIDQLIQHIPKGH